MDSSLKQIFISAGFTTEDANALRRHLAAASTEQKISLVDKAARAAPKGHGFSLPVRYKHHVRRLRFDPPKTVALICGLINDPSPPVRLRLIDKLEVNLSPAVVLTGMRGQDESGGGRRGAGYKSSPDYGVASALLGLCLPLQNAATANFMSGALPPVNIVGGTVERLFADVFVRRAAARAEEGLASLPAETVRRQTEVGFRRSDTGPAEGELTFGLKVQSAAAPAHAVDIRVPAGKPHATILVQAFSHDLEISPEVRMIRVPRRADSETAKFAVRALRAGEGEVGLLIYDEYRLIGSLSVKLSAADDRGRLELSDRAVTTVFRDAGATPPGGPAGPAGITIPVSLKNEAGRRIEYHRLYPQPGGGGTSPPGLVPLGNSAVSFDAEGVRTSLETLRAFVEEVLNNLDEGRVQRLGATSRDEALSALHINFEGVGIQIANDLLSPQVRALFREAPAGTVVNWVIRDRPLDGIPWELSYDQLTKTALQDRIVLVRVPVLIGSEPWSSQPATTAGQADRPAAPARGTLLYILGDEVGRGAEYPQFFDVVRAAEGKYEVARNFDENGRRPVNIVSLYHLSRTANVIHLLCHGMTEDGRGSYLEIEQNLLGRINPIQVGGFNLQPGTLVFVNACSSAAATFSPAGLTTFGGSFIQSGAAAYIGTLAPVTKRLALAFAREFFDAHLGQGRSVPESVFLARRALAGDPDPTWTLYAVYGDVHDLPAPGA